MALGRASAFAALVATVDGSRLPRRDGYQMYEGKPLLEVSVCKESEAKTLKQALEVRACHILGDDFGPVMGECMDVNAVCYTHNDAKDLVQRYPDSMRLQADDAAKHFRSVSGSSKDFDSRTGTAADYYSDWRSLEARESRVAQLVNNAPSNVKVTLEKAGESYEKRDIMLVRFRGDGYVEGGPRVVLTYNLHAREWIAGMAGVYTVEKLIETVAADPDFIKGTEVILMPMCNPDGFKYTETEQRFHRKNTNGVESAGWFCTGGVDLNRNFDAHWGQGGSSGNYCQDTYHGTGPASEAETQVVQNVVKQSSRTDVYVDVHSYTQLVLSSWGWTRDNHPRKAEFDALGEKIKGAIEARHNSVYRYGSAAQTLYPASGTATDFGTVEGALGYCFELRPRFNQALWGFAPNADQILPCAEETWDGTVEAIKYAVAKR